MAWLHRYLALYHFRPLGLFLLCCLAIGSAGCAAKLKSIVVGSLIEDFSAATARQDDLALVVSGAPTFLLLLEGLLEGSPDDQALLIAATKAYTSYAILIEAEDPIRARRLYFRAKEHGLKALSQKKPRARLLRAPFAQFITIFDHLDTGDVPAVFWTASSWGAWISANTGSMAALAELPKVIELMQWVLEQDESYQYGSPHIFLGVYHAALPKLLGGDPERSLHHFDRALEISQGQVLMVHVLKAKFYARQIFDRSMYETLLVQALDRPADETPELTLQNIAAQEQARVLLSQIDEFF